MLPLAQFGSDRYNHCYCLLSAVGYTVEKHIVVAGSFDSVVQMAVFFETKT